jgi:MFS family permease
MALARTEGLVQLFVFLIGLGGGILNGATNALVADISAGERGAKLSLLGVFFGIGALVMPTTIAMLTYQFQFELASIVAGIGALTLGPAVFCLAIDFPAPKQRQERFSLSRVGHILLDPVVLVACLLLAIQSGMEGMSNDWMTRYFKNVTLAGREFGEWQIQLGLIAVTLAMVVTRLLLALLLSRVGSRVVLLGSIVVAAGGATLLLASPGYGASLCAALLIGAGLAAAFPVVLGLIGDRYPGQAGTAFSTIFFFALIGNMVINKSFGYIAQAQGIQHYATFMLALLGSSAVLLVLLETLTKRLEKGTGTPARRGSEDSAN